MKVLLLGATGLLGHNVLLRLVDEGHQVRALVRCAEGLKLKDLCEVREGSPLDYDCPSTATSAACWCGWWRRRASARWCTPRR